MNNFVCAVRGREVFCLPHIHALEVSFHIYKMEILLSSSQGVIEVID